MHLPFNLAVEWTISRRPVCDMSVITSVTESLAMPQLPFSGQSENLPLIRTAGGTTFVDLDAYAAGLANDPLFRSLHPERQNNPAQFDREYKKSLERMDPTVYLLRPTADDSPSIKYAVMEPRGNIPSLCIRFWYGPYGYLFGYNFDLVDRETKEPVFAPIGLLVEFFADGRWYEMMANTEAMLRSAGVDPASDDFRVPEKWQTTPGNLLRFSDGLSGVVVGEVRTPPVPVGQNPHYECVSELP